MKIIKSKVVTNYKVYADSWRSYDSLVIDGCGHHRINHSKEFSKGKRNHINGIESFWSYAKGKMQKYYGISAKRLYLHLKEMEFRFNSKNSRNLAELIEKILISRVLFYTSP